MNIKQILALIIMLFTGWATFLGMVFLTQTIRWHLIPEYKKGVDILGFVFLLFYGMAYIILMTVVYTDLEEDW